MTEIDSSKYPFASALQKTLRTNNVSYISYLLDTYGRTDDVYQRIRKALPIVINQSTDIFPRVAKIRNSGSYIYASVSPNYLNKIAPFLNWFENQFDKNHLSILTKSCNPQNNYSIVAPGSPVGAHITLGSNSTNLIGQQVEFKVDELVDYYHDKLGYSNSGYNLAPCRWFVLRVSGPNIKFYGDHPHISVDLLAVGN